jgi:hypothetical protein
MSAAVTAYAGVAVASAPAPEDSAIAIASSGRELLDDLDMREKPSLGVMGMNGLGRLAEREERSATTCRPGLWA